MQKVSYVIKDHQGIHARPAGELVKLVKEMDSKVTIGKDGKAVTAAKVLAIMSLNVKFGQTVEVSVDGGDEAANAAKIEEFLKANL